MPDENVRGRRQDRSGNGGEASGGSAQGDPGASIVVQPIDGMSSEGAAMG